MFYMAFASDSNYSDYSTTFDEVTILLIMAFVESSLAFEEVPFSFEEFYKVTDEVGDTAFILLLLPNLTS
jgi:hypothetical protein